MTADENAVLSLIAIATDCIQILQNYTTVIELINIASDSVASKTNNCARIDFVSFLQGVEVYFAHRQQC